jgi:hypothetical protein
LRHWDTRRKVAGAIPDGITGIFLWLNSHYGITPNGYSGQCVGLTT